MANSNERLDVSPFLHNSTKLNISKTVFSNSSGVLPIYLTKSDKDKEVRLVNG